MNLRLPIDLNAITGLSETYLTPAIDYLTENDLVSDDQVAMLYEILLQVGVLLGNQEDGLGQAEVDAAYAAGAASVEVPEIITEDISMDLPQGWIMFGYTCIESVDVLGGFASISDKIEIVKDEWGLAYLPEWGFSAFDNLEFGEGYQIKMTEEVSGFQFCYTIVGTSSQEEAEPEAEPLQIGDQHAGGIVFQINEDGTGLVADLQDLGETNWYFDAMAAAVSATSQD